MRSVASSGSTGQGISTVPDVVPTRRLILSAAGAVAAWVAVRLAAGFPPGMWPSAGSIFVGPTAPKELVIKQGDGGYDGQFVYRLAIEPFTTATTGHGITFYQPGYRQQRIMTALLAHLVSGVPGPSTAVAIIIVNALALVVALVAGVRIAESFGFEWGWGLLLALPACLPASFALDLTEPVEWAGVLCAVLAARRGRWLLAGIAFTFAVLARETAGAFVAGYVIESIVVLLPRREAREWARAWLLMPVVVEAAWQVRLWAVWGSVPALTGFGNTVVSGTTSSHVDALRSEGASNSYPLLGIARTFLNGFVTGDTSRPVLGVTYVIERTVLLLLIGTAAWLLVTRRVRIGIALTVAWVLAALVALSMSGWVDDIQFLRPTMEVWALSILVLLHSRTKWSLVLLRAAIAVVSWQVIFGLIRS